MLEFPKVEADKHWWSAIDFETHSTLSEIDDWRKWVLEKYTRRAEELESEREAWLRGVPKNS